MPDNYAINETPPVAPDEPLKTNVGTTRVEPVAVKEEPTVTLSAVDYEAVRSVIDIMEGRLNSIAADALFDFEKKSTAAIEDYKMVLKRFKDVKEQDLTMLRKLLRMDGPVITPNSGV